MKFISWKMLAQCRILFSPIFRQSLHSFRELEYPTVSSLGLPKQNSASKQKLSGPNGSLSRNKRAREAGGYKNQNQTKKPTKPQNHTTTNMGHSGDVVTLVTAL